LIVDANILTSAFLGHSFPLLVASRERGIILAMPVHQYAETKMVLARKLTLPGDAIDAVALPIIEVIPVQAYAGFESEARARLHARGQPDWPVLAAALAYQDEIWSNDRDLFGAGVAVWSTRNIDRVTGEKT
jgi:predicted nucleic acid-binding protein